MDDPLLADIETEDLLSFGDLGFQGHSNCRYSPPKWAKNSKGVPLTFDAEFGDTRADWRKDFAAPVIKPDAEPDDPAGLTPLQKRMAWGFFNMLADWTRPVVPGEHRQWNIKCAPLKYILCMGSLRMTTTQTGQDLLFQATSINWCINGAPFICLQTDETCCCKRPA